MLLKELKFFSDDLLSADGREVNGAKKRGLRQCMKRIEINARIDQMRPEKQRIFEVSLRLLSEGRFHATSMAEIASLAKMSSAMMDIAFESRDKVLAELMEATLSNIERPVREAGLTSATFKDRFFKSWQALFQFYSQHPHAISFVEQFEDIQRRAYPVDLVHPARLKSLVEIFRFQTDLKTDMPPESLAWLLHENALTAAKMNVVRSCNVSSSAYRLVDILWKGIFCSNVAAL